ncbi:MAG: IS21 family transposase, partial [Actinomycetota bacterium]|nr:IS21 family transposase [Actinomycetota bacterium]
VEAAVVAGLTRDGGEDQVSDVLIGTVCNEVRPARPAGHGAGWESLVPHEAEITGWLAKDLKLVKVQDLLARKGVVVAYRTLNRFATQRCGFGERKTTVRVADGEPGSELQVDFGRMGLVPDPTTGQRRMTWALIFTACYSRHCFVWLSHRQTTAAVIEGFEAAWAFFGGVFAVVIPDNMAAIVIEADDVEPRFNDAFLEYAQSRGFVIDPARVRSPKDKPKVERQVQYVRGSYFAGESFVDLADAQRRAETWCATTAGLRTHGTTQCRPLEVFRAEEAPVLLPAPTEAYDLPLYAKPKVHRDHHIEVDKALYSIPGNLIGTRVNARADARLVKVFHRGQLIKVHPRQRPGGRHTDARDLPTGTEVYAMRDIETLKARAAGHGPAVGAYATALLDSPLPWTRMRQVYRLLGLAKKWGPQRVEAACARALEAEAVDVGLISRMLERATESAQPAAATTTAAANVVPGRFSRDASEFATGEGARP